MILKIIIIYMEDIFMKFENVRFKNDCSVKMENNDVSVDMGSVGAKLEKESVDTGNVDAVSEKSIVKYVETDWDIEVDDVRRSDFSIVFNDFGGGSLLYSKSFDYETFDLMGKIYYKGEWVDSFICQYCDTTGESIVADEEDCLRYVLVDREFLEQVMRQYMTAVLAKLYGANKDWRPESRVSMVFESLHCALCRDEDSTFMVYADDEDELDEMDIETAKSKRFIENARLNKLVYISDDEFCEKVRLYL